MQQPRGCTWTNSRTYVLSRFFCSDGGGRSGVYLSIDANLELAEEEDCFDVFGYLKTLRQSRKGMVETLVSSTSYCRYYISDLKYTVSII